MIDGATTHAPDRRIFSRILGPFREFGLLPGMAYVVNRILRRLHPRLGLIWYDLMAQPVSDKPLLPAGLARNLTFRELEADSAEVAQMAARQEVKASRFAQGATALGAFRKNELIGYVWFCTGRYVEDELRCVYEFAYPERSVFDFDLVVMPDSRMGVGFAALWQCANQYLTSRGIRTSYSRVTRFNLASRRAHQRLGATRIGMLFALQIGPLEFMLASVRGHPRASVTIRRSPGIVLDA
jgi:hypothetical protein